MIDTVRLQSPFLTEEDAAAVEANLDVIMRVGIADCKTKWELTTGSLEGSWDNRISVKVERSSWVDDHQGKKLTKVPSAPYMIIEGSVHKALIGHNVWGGPNDVYACCRWLVDHIGALLGVSLPDGKDWLVRRIDWAEAFEVGRAGAEEYISALAWASFPRRRVLRYGSECVMAPGDMTTVKVYHKGPEFRKHDLKSWRVLDMSMGQYLLDAGMDILRAEVSIRARKLDTLESCRVDDMNEEWLRGVWFHELQKLVDEAEGLEVVRTAREVKARLYERYSDRLARTLYGTWLELAALGDSETRVSMSARTWYRQKAQLKNAGVSWRGSDVEVTHSSIPQGFGLLNDVRKLDVVSGDVTRALADYERVAA